MSVSSDTQALDTSPAAFATKIQNLRSMLYAQTPVPVPNDVVETFVSDDNNNISATNATPPVQGQTTTPGFMLADAADTLSLIMNDLGISLHQTPNQGTEDTRLTIRLRAQLDALSLTLTGQPLPILTEELMHQDDTVGAQTNMRCLCAHAERLIDGLNGTTLHNARSGNASTCTVM